MKNTLIQLLYESTQRFPDRDAIVFGSDKLNYKSLWDKACGISHYLVNNGLKPQQRVSLLIENSTEYVASYYGVLMAGGCVVGLNTSAKSRDLSNWIRHSHSSFLIAHSQHSELDSIRNSLSDNDIKYVYIGDRERRNEGQYWEDIESHQELNSVVNELDAVKHMAAIIYTSGTTGSPKGVMLSHSNLYNNVVSILGYLELTYQDSIVNVLPFYYSYGNSVLHTHLAVGARIIIENSMMYPQKILTLMADEKVTGFSGVPSTYNLLLSRTKLSDYDLSSIRYMTQAGGAMAPVAIMKLTAQLPHILFFVMYGQTEATARLSYLPPNKLSEKIGSVGIAINDVDLAVMDDHFNQVSPEVTGEVYARGNNIMLGYWMNESTTSSVLYNGWLKTGDLAYKDADGYLYLIGRSSDMIKSGAHRISPNDVEEVILEIDGVDDVAVVGVDDDLLGSAIKAVIVLTPGRTLDKMQILRHCKLNLANYKLPKYIEFTEQLPRTSSGKIRRFMLQ